MPPDPSMPQNGQQPPPAPPPPVDPHANDARQWAGDAYNEGDEPQPDDASVTSHFGDQNGEEAWLQRADDGTLTGWVRDATGQVYRYSDADAWAIDVDDAGMSPSSGGSTDAAPADGQDPNADPNQDPQAAPNADPNQDPSMTDPNADPNQDGTQDGTQDNQPPWLKRKK